MLSDMEKEMIVEANSLVNKKTIKGGIVKNNDRQIHQVFWHKHPAAFAIVRPIRKYCIRGDPINRYRQAFRAAGVG